MILLLPAMLQATAVFETPHGVLRLTNFSTTAANLEDDTLSATGTSATAVKVEDTASGLTLQAKTLSVKLKRLETGKYSLLSANAQGNADAIFDSGVAQQAASDSATKLGQPVPPKPDFQLQWQISSDQFQFMGMGEDGTLNLSGRLRYRWSRVQTGFSQRLDLQSGDGAVEVRSTGTPGNFVPTSGRLSGPIEFTFEQDDLKSRNSFRATGTGNSMTADFMAEEGIELKLAGQVVARLTETRPRSASSDSPLMTNNANVTGDEATVILDRATRKPLRYRFTGKPAETRLRPGGHP